MKKFLKEWWGSMKPETRQYSICGITIVATTLIICLTISGKWDLVFWFLK